MDEQGQLFGTTEPQKTPQQKFVEPMMSANERRQYKKMTRTEDPITSIEASKKLLPKIKGHKLIVLKAFYERGPAGYTHEKLGHNVPIRPDTARKRTKDLVDAGLIEDSGEKEAVSSGNLSIIWRITPLGRLEHNTLET